MRIKVIFLVSTLLFAPLLCGVGLKVTSYGLCEKIIDGDTLIVNGIKLRLYGIDAPELEQKSYSGIKIGRLSKNYLENLILGKKLKIVIIKKGKYKRSIAKVYFKGEEVNLKLLKSGHATHYWTDDMAYINATLQAKLKQVGLWKLESFSLPSYFRYRSKKFR